MTAKPEQFRMHLDFGSGTCCVKDECARCQWEIQERGKGRMLNLQLASDINDGRALI